MGEFISLKNITVSSNDPFNMMNVSQMSYSLVVMLELNGVSEVQYKEIMIVDNE